MEVGVNCPETGTVEDHLDSARLAEDLGYDSLWVTEHHAWTEEYMPAPLVRLGAIATVTAEITLGTGILVLPLHSPIDVAERCAVIDRLSGGRLILGVGMGHVEAEFEAFGVPMDERAGRLVEGLHVLGAYFRGDGPITVDGRYWSITDWERAVDPVQPEGPPIWLGGRGDRALERSVRLADAWLPDARLDEAGVVRRRDALREYREGRDDAAERARPLRRFVAIAESDAAAREVAAEHLATPTWPAADVRTADAGTLAAEGCLVGSPETIRDQIRRLRRELAVDHLIARFHATGLSQEHVREQMRLLAERVLPAVR